MKKGSGGGGWGAWCQGEGAAAAGTTASRHPDSGGPSGLLAVMCYIRHVFTPAAFVRLFPLGCLAPAVGKLAQELLQLTGGGRRDERPDAPPTTRRSHFSIMKMLRSSEDWPTVVLGCELVSPKVRHKCNLHFLT